MTSRPGYCHLSKQGKGGHVGDPIKSRMSWTFFLRKNLLSINLQSCWPRAWKHFIECFHMTSGGHIGVPFKTIKRRPCWCPKPLMWELNSFLMQTFSLVPINLHRCQPCEWKRFIVSQRIHGSSTELVEIKREMRKRVDQKEFQLFHFFPSSLE